MSVQSEVNRINGLKATLANYLKSIEEASGTESLETLIGKAITIMSSYGDRITDLENLDTAMSSTSEKGVQNKVIKAYIDGQSSSSFASMFQINMASEYFVSEESEAPNIISNSLNLDGFVNPVGTSGISWKKPTVDVPAITWSPDVDDNYNITGTGTVNVHFGEAGSVSKTITFKKPGEGKLYACRLSDSTSLIDTGIEADYSYRYHCKGHPTSGNQCVFLDAYLSNTERATARILSGSNKIQSMWYVNREVTAASAGMDFKKMFEFTVGANYLKLTQGATEYSPTITGQTTSGSVGTNIMVLGSASGSLGNGILCFAEILDGGGNQLAYFSPYKIQDTEVVLINTSGLTAQEIYDIVQNGDGSSHASGRIFRPTSGYLIEVTQAEDEA